MIRLRPALAEDAAAIGAVHVRAWRSAYAGILPDAYLAQLSATRQAAYYAAGFARGYAGFVAEGGTGHRRFHHDRPALARRSPMARSTRSTCSTTGASTVWAAR